MNEFVLKEFKSTVTLYNKETVDLFFKDFVRPFKKVLDFKIKNDGDYKKEIIFIPGNSFIFDFSQTQYYHLMQDTIGQFLAIKKYIPDTKIIFLRYNRITDISVENILNDLKKIFNIKEEDVIYIKDYHEIVLESVIYFHTFFNSFLSAIDDVMFIDKKDDPDFIFQVIAAKELRSLILPFIENYNYLDKKIYISRYQGELTLYEDMKSAQKRKNKKSIDTYSQRIEERTFKNREDLIKLEEFFMKNDYEIVSLERLGIIRQAELFYNAKIIATFNGTSSYNSIFANEDTNIILMNIHHNYSWIHKDIFHALDINFFEAPPQNFEHTKINYDEIIDYIEKCVLS
jgi:hypothetical protein